MERTSNQSMRALETELITNGYNYIIGVDEAGRGPLAGPVVAAAVSLPRDLTLDNIKDSKALSPQKRIKSYEEISRYGQIGIGLASPQEIDTYNILQASLLAMKRGISKIHPSPDICLIDGNQRIPGLYIEQRLIVRGDATQYLIAAASIIAKVHRDTLMEQYHLEYPEYGFAQHKGYPTKEHIQALGEFGPTPIHRHSFQRVKRGNIS